MKLGILGGGQLARMLALAGHPLGVSCVVLDPSPDACANVVAGQVVGAYDDADALARFSDLVSIATYEFENLPAESVAQVAEHVSVYPSAEALYVARDRLREKTLFRELGIATPAFAAVDGLDDLQAAVERIGVPSILKTRTLGYDGKGQFIIRPDTNITEVWEQTRGVPCILESFVPFVREISIIAVRNRNGACRFYPVVENTHEGGILRLSMVRPDDARQAEAEAYARILLERLGYVGVMALELFDTGDALVANEMAPRVHNSGHWTIEGAVTSQFENHLRAVLGLPLGSCGLVHGAVAMVNLIGKVPDPEDILNITGAHLHVYGKSARPGRKVGHVTICGPDVASITHGVTELQAMASDCDV